MVCEVRAARRVSSSQREASTNVHSRAFYAIIAKDPFSSRESRICCRFGDRYGLLPGGAPVGWSQDKKEQPDQPKKIDGQDKKKDEKEEIKLAGPLGKLSVAWHGQSFFSVQTKAGTVLAFDPHAISQYGSLTSELRPDIIFISHNHNDHTRIEIFKNIAEKGPALRKSSPA